MAIARFPSIVLDCPDAAALATFYGALLDWKVDSSAQEVPQQMHLDVIVDDLDAGESAVLALGATNHEHQPGTTFRVFLDPAGHPFCLCAD